MAWILRGVRRPLAPAGEVNMRSRRLKLADPQAGIGEEVIDGKKLRHESRLGIDRLSREDRVPKPLVLSSDDLRHERPVEPVSRPVHTQSELGRFSNC